MTAHPEKQSCDELRERPGLKQEGQHALPRMFPRRFGHSSFRDESFFRRWGESVALRLIGLVPRAYDDDSEGDKSELFVREGD